MVYDGMKSENKIKLVINGVTIPKLSDYSYFDAKSFFTEPKRSANGVINNLNAYATFLTPRLKFSFKLMPVETYRTLMKLIKEFNEFIVTVYDIVEDTYVTRKMYFYPKDFPQIFQHSLEVLAIRDEEFEMVGTNADLDEYSLVYHSNTDADLTSGLPFTYGQEIRIGDYIDEDGTAIDPTTFTKTGYRLNNWNTKADGTGFTYLTGEVVTLTTNTSLYAQWVAVTDFVLSFDYQGATANNTELNREVSQNSAIGELPTPIRNGYVFGGWFTLQDGKGTQITATSIFNYDSNKTIYAYWVGVDNTITFDANGGTGTMETLTVKTGEEIELPSATFTKEGKVFEKWVTNADGTGTTYNDGAKIKMPDGNLVLYAQYAQGYYLTYNTNGGINDGYKDFGKVIKSPMFTQKDGFSFVGWYKDAEFTTGITFPITLNADKTIYAKWEEING